MVKIIKDFDQNLKELWSKSCKICGQNLKGFMILVGENLRGLFHKISKDCKNPKVFLSKA